jgi:hypothetical protein
MEPLTQTYLMPSVEILSSMQCVDQIYFQTHEKKGWEPSEEELQRIRTLEDRNIDRIPLSWRPFGALYLLMASVQLAYLFLLIRRKQITHIHAFAPVAGIYGYILKRLTGKKLIIDSWEPHAEAMAQTGAWKTGGLAHRMLFYFEKLQARHADVLIAGSLQMHQYAAERLQTVRKDWLYRPAGVDASKFYPLHSERETKRKQLDWENACVCICVSKLGGLYLSEELFSILTKLSELIGESFRFLLLSQNDPQQILQWAQKAGFDAKCMIHLHANPTDVPAWLSAADFAINPQFPVPAKRYGTPVKDAEYWASGLPILIMPEIGDDSNIIVQEKAGAILQSLEKPDIEKAMSQIMQIMRDPNHRAKIHQIAIRYRSFAIAKDVYERIYCQ